MERKARRELAIAGQKVLFLFLLASSFTYLLMMLRPTLFFQKGDYLSYTTGLIATAVLMGVVLGFIAPYFPGIVAGTCGVASGRIYGNSAGADRVDFN